MSPVFSEKLSPHVTHNGEYGYCFVQEKVAEGRGHTQNGECLLGVVHIVRKEV